MTYCAGILTEHGLVFASDSRTNAGVDHISTFRKTFVFEKAGERALVLMTAGNLAITQAVVHILEEQIQRSQAQEKEKTQLEALRALDKEASKESKKKGKDAKDGKTADVESNKVNSLFTANNMVEAVRIVGKAIRQVYDSDAEYLRKHGVDFHASIIFGGQIGKEKHRLFNVYTAGNFIEATPETPYLQIGESKYGKPIIDRVVKYNSALDEVTKCLLVSFDSTIRSNVSVAMPIHLLCYEKDTLKIEKQKMIDDKDEYFNTMRKGWSEGLKQVFANLPNMPW